MFNHPGARNAGPMGPGMTPGGGGSTAPRPMMAPATPQVRPMQQSRPLGMAPHQPQALMPQRQALSTGMERQKVMANALRGGGIQAAPHFLVNHAQGLPGIK